MGDIPLDEVLALEAEGFLLSAHDRAMAAIEAGAEDPRLRHRAVLTLARPGATARALELFERLRLQDAPDTEAAALGARLLKDLALATAGPRAGLLARAAAERYEALWRETGEGYHGVNAAALRLLAGDRAAAAERARAVLRRHRDDADGGDYWSAATAAEAALLAGDAERAVRLLEEAEARAGRDLAARATTRRQMRWEARLLSADAGLIETLRIPATIHYCGHMPRPGDGPDGDDAALAGRIAATLGDLRIGAAFGGLAAGADILFTEALLARGVVPSVLLPADLAGFVARSVRPAGEAWVARFEALLPHCRALVLDERRIPEDDLDLAMAARRAMGLARLHAERLDGAALQLAVWDGGPPRGVAGTAADVEAWGAAGGRTVRIDWPWPRPTPAGPEAPDAAPATPAARSPPRRPRAVLFGDLPGFGALDDAALGAFYAGPMRALGAAVDRHAPSYRNAWGDAVQLVFEEVAAAAACAAALRDAMAPDSLAAAGLPATLVPRLALDFGPLLEVEDAVQRICKFAGRAMTRAARIEPVTPPGRIYATEALACEVALGAAPGLFCDYAGQVPTAKGFGVLPLYALRRARPGAAAPAASAVPAPRSTP
jgi:hypothetical protein